MKTRTPLGKYDLKIQKNEKVLEVGFGHNPHNRSDIIVEKFIDTNYHRSGDVRFFPHQTFVNADGSDLPFKDKEFDYVICNQVLGHVDDPVTFIKNNAGLLKDNEFFNL